MDEFKKIIGRWAVIGAIIYMIIEILVRCVI